MAPPAEEKEKTVGTAHGNVNDKPLRGLNVLAKHMLPWGEWPRRCAEYPEHRVVAMRLGVYFELIFPKRSR